MQVQLAVITVNGNEVSRADEVQHELQFFDARVSRDVDGRDAAVVVVHASAAAVEVVNHTENGFLISRNDPRRNHHVVVRFDGDPAMVLHRHP